MVHSTSVTFDDMRAKLLPLDAVRERLAATEPLAQHTFPANSGFQLRIEDEWAETALTAPVEAFIRTAPALAGGSTYRLTHQSLLELGAAVGIPRKLQERLPRKLLVDQINWWFSGAGAGDKVFKLLSLGSQTPDQPVPGTDQAAESGTVLALCRGTIQPFSNLHMMDMMLSGLGKAYGEGEVLADYKFVHDLERTNMRLIVPGQSRVITNTRQADDTWSVGLDYYNSLIGLKQTNLAGYMFRWWCTNGCTDTLTSARFSRRGNGGTEEEALAWAAEKVDAILGGLEGALDGVQALTEMPVEHDVTTTLRDFFTQFSIPVSERRRIIASMADLGGQLTMYDLQNAITQAANMDGLSPNSAQLLMGLGGHVAHAANGRCNEAVPCRRLLPDGFTPPEPHPAAAN